MSSPLNAAALPRQAAAVPPRRKRASGASHKRWLPALFLGPAVLIMAVACLYPVLSAFQLALFDWNMGTPWSEARWVGLDNFRAAFSNPQVWSSLWTTLLFAAVCVSAEMVLGIALALALEHPVRGTAFFRTLFILPMMIAPIAVGLAWRYLFDAQFGLINAVLALFGIAAKGWLSDPSLAFMAIVVADVWQWTPFVFIMMVAALANVDGAVIEASRIDGARWWQMTFLVKLPMVMNVIAITLMMRLIDAFRVLEVIYVLTFGGPGDSTEILALHIYKTAFVGQQLGVAAAISVLLLVVVAALSWGALRLSNPMKNER
jgi:multiple sugar transport system permease protein